MPAHGPQHYAKTARLPHVRATRNRLAAGVRKSTRSFDPQPVELSRVLPMPLVPHRFLFRVAHPCRHVKRIPCLDGDRLLDLPTECRIDNFAAMDEKRNFADVSLAWNGLGLGLQVEVR